MTADEVRPRLRQALSALYELEVGLEDALAALPQRKLPIGRRDMKFAVQDVDDARDAVFACGRRYGLTPQDLGDPLA